MRFPKLISRFIPLIALLVIACGQQATTPTPAPVPAPIITPTVATASIAISSPKQGEKFSRGDTIILTWSSKGNPADFVRISLRQKGAVQMKDVFHQEKDFGWISEIPSGRPYNYVTDVPDNGTYKWKVPEFLSPGDYSLAVGLPAASGLSQESPKFTIVQ